MTKLFAIASFVCIAIGLIFVYQTKSTDIGKNRVAPETPRIEILKAAYSKPDSAPENPSTKDAEAFARFPLKKPIVVDFRAGESTWDRLSDREKRDQALDWLLFTIVSQSELDSDEINRALYNIPEIRHAHLRNLARWEYGLTRHCFIGNGVVVALFPKCSDTERRDYLGHIADESRKSMGRKPKKLIEFEYTLDQENLAAELTRNGEATSNSLFSERFGYVEKEVENLGEFKNFMESVQTITFAELANSGLLLGGRKLKSREYRGIQVEDVAAVWQAQEQLAGVRRKHEGELKAIHRKWEKKLDELNSNSGFGTSRAEYERKAGILQAGFDAESENFQLDALKKGRLLDHTGFSLDPSYDYLEMLKFVKSLSKQLDEIQENNIAGYSKAEFDSVLDELKDKNKASRLWKFLNQVNHSSTSVSSLAIKYFESNLTDEITLEELNSEQVVSHISELISELGELVKPDNSESEEASKEKTQPEVLKKLDLFLKEPSAVSFRNFESSLDNNGSFIADVLDLRLKLVKSRLEEEGVDDWVLISEFANDSRVDKLVSAYESAIGDLVKGNDDGFQELLDDKRSFGLFQVFIPDDKESDMVSNDVDGQAWIARRYLTELNDWSESNPEVEVWLDQLKESIKSKNEEALEKVLDEFPLQLSEVSLGLRRQLSAALQDSRKLDFAELASSFGKFQFDEQRIEFLVELKNSFDSDETFREWRSEFESELQESIFSVADIERIESKDFNKISFNGALLKRLDDLRQPKLSGVASSLRSVRRQLTNWAKTTNKKLPTVIAKLETNDDDRIVPLLMLIDEQKKAHGEFFGAGLTPVFAEWLDENGNAAFRFQKARYDGNLGGTEVGMILFYTDLLAKLWAGVGFDTPTDSVDEFRSMTDGYLAPMYEKEIEEQPSTRLWFGLEKSSIQIAENQNKVFFARRATRIYSASSNPLRPGIEVPTSFTSEEIMGWWNDHYEEIAEYEQEYERLNEYMKWSVVIGLLDGLEKSSRMDFLNSVDVDRDAWFPNWIKEKKLRFKNWNQVSFHKKGERGWSKTESMPILFSKMFSRPGDMFGYRQISGGVSGARPSELIVRPSLPREISPKLKLSLAGADPKSLSGTGRRLRTLRGTEHSFEGNGVSSVKRSRPPKDADSGSALPMRSRDTELSSGKSSIERTIEKSKDQFVAKTQFGPRDLGTLSIAPSGNGFTIAFKSGLLEQVCSMAKAGSRAGEDIAATVLKHPAVELFATTKEGLFVKFDGHKDWVRFSPEREPKSRITESWVDARVSDPSGPSKTWNVGILNKEQMPDIVKPKQFAFEFAINERHAPKLLIRNRGPPSGSVKTVVTFESNGVTEQLTVHLSKDGRTIFVEAEALPETLKNAPELVERVLSKLERTEIENAIKSGEDTLKLSPKSEPKLREERFISQLEGGKKSEAAEMLANEPGKFQAVIKRDLSERMEKVRRSMNADRPSATLDIIEETIKVHGKTTELSVAKASCNIELGRLRVAQEIFEQELSSPKEFVSVMNRMLRGAGEKTQQKLKSTSRSRALRDLGDDLSLNAKTGEIEAALLEFKSEKLPEIPESVDFVFVKESVDIDLPAGGRREAINSLLESGELEIFRVLEPKHEMFADLIKATADGPDGKSGSFRRTSLAKPVNMTKGYWRIALSDDDDEYCEELVNENDEIALRICRNASVILLYAK